MAIDPTQTNTLSRLNPQTATQSTRNTNASREAARPAASESTEVHRTDTADTSRDIDTARVEEIRAGIADGSLTFDSNRIADGLLASARDLVDGDSA